MLKPMRRSEVNDGRFGDRAYSRPAGRALRKTSVSTAALTRRNLLAGAAALAILTRDSRGADVVKEDAPGRELFAKPALVNIRLALTAEDQASLREKPRDWVIGTATLNDQELPRVAVRVKGVTSFLPLDKKPSFTLDFGKMVKGRRVFGQSKTHLNNSVQDSSFMGDDLSSELFRRASVPAARTAWARVHLNERDLGLYVLKESCTPEYLGLFFPRTDGNVYDSGTHREISDPLELASGHGPKDHSDLKALFAAAQVPDLTARWQALQKTLDVDRFVAMMAMESLTCHIDGYSQMQNNYRIYFEPGSGKAVFMVHGLDQMFGHPDAPLDPPLRGALALAIMAIPEGRQAYRQRLADQIKNVLEPEWMAGRIDAAIRVFEPVDAVAARDARLFKERALARAAFARKNTPLSA